MLRCSACTEFIEVKQDERKPSVMLRLLACTEYYECKAPVMLRLSKHDEVKHDEMKHNEPFLIEFTLPPITIGEGDRSFYFNSCKLCHIIKLRNYY